MKKVRLKIFKILISQHKSKGVPAHLEQDTFEWHVIQFRNEQSEQQEICAQKPTLIKKIIEIVFQS